MDLLAKRMQQSLQMDAIAVDFSKNYNDLVKKPNKKLFKKVIDCEFKRKVDQEVDLFAHGECAVYSEGLINTLSLLDYDPKLIALVENGTPIHYLALINNKGKDLYIDAYGVFDSLEPIQDRYSENTVDKVFVIDVSEEAESGLDIELANIVEIWRDKTSDFMNCFDIDEYLDKHNIDHYVDLYEDFLVSLISNSFESTWIQNKEDAPRLKKTTSSTLDM